MNEPTGSAGDFSGVWYPDPMDVALMATDTTLQNDISTQEELKRFWEKCGVSLEHEWDNRPYGYEITDCICTRCGISDWPPGNEKKPCLLPLTLDNLFKYGVTRALKEIRLWVLLRKWYEEIVNLAGTDEIKDNRIVILALYHALDKVLEG